MKKFVLLAFALVFLVSFHLPITRESTSFFETVVCVDPSTNDVSVGDTFVINVSLADDVWLQEFEFYLGYNTTILDSLNAWVHSPYEAPFEPQINDTEGYVHVFAIHEGPIPSALSVSESFPLASVTFKATAVGSSFLDLYGIILIGGLGAWIDYTTINGSVTVSSAIITVPDDYPTIQEAINAASPGDTIYVHNGTYYENVIVNKTVSLIGEDKYSTIIDAGSFGNVIEVTASNVKINSFTIQKSGIFYPFGCGIYVGEWSSGNNISCNIIALNSFGIRLFNSSSNIISENNIKANEYSGILLNSSKNNRIFRNDITNNDVGIALYESTNNSISGNNIANNRGGIYEFDSSFNIISGNNITNNWSGFWLGFGIGLMDSSHNFIYHNNFVNNYEGQVLTEVSVNFWDDGYPSGGNYWSDYPDVDLLGGPYQNETGSDGIGDTSYTIDFYNRDNYPLMGMFSDFKATSEFHVQTICNSSIFDFQYNGTAICFNVTGETDTTGFCRICVPRALMNETYKVFVNGTEVPSSLLPCSNTTHSYLYFTYDHSTQEVIIIPEFPTLTSMLLLLILLTVAIAIYKRRLLEKPIH